MPILKRNEIDFREDKGGKTVAFMQGVVDECGLKEKDGNIVGYDIRIKTGHGEGMRHIYHRVWLNNADRFNEYDAPKLAEVFGYTGGMRDMIAGDCEEWFLGKPVGVRLTPDPKHDERYYTSLYKAKVKATVDADARRRKLEELGLAQPVAAVAESEEDLSLPF